MGLRTIPVEVYAIIAQLLDDKDIASFAATCSEVKAHIYDDHSPLWRTKFSEHYDLVPGIRNSELAVTYRLRRKILHRGVNFTNGATNSQLLCLRVLRGLIIESFAGRCAKTSEGGILISKNLQAIYSFVVSSNLLHNVCDTRFSKFLDPLLATIQLMLTNLRFEKDFPTQVLGFWDTQKAMYATAEQEPIFRGKSRTNIDLNWVLKAVNFFKHHFASDENVEMRDEYEALADTDKIRAWRRPLTTGAHSLGKRWKGAYAFLEHDEIARMRRLSANDDHDIFMDKFHSDGDQDRSFQTLHLDFSARNATKKWPKIFERHLQSLSHPSATYLANTEPPWKPKPAKSATRAQHRTEAPSVAATKDAPTRPTRIDPATLSLNFKGSGEDGDKFYAAGWLNPLPPQEGVLGWMRWTMVKFFVDGETSTSDSDDEEGNPFAMRNMEGSNPFAHMDLDALWAYEGVVLPGGEAVVGRWWSPQMPDEDEEEEEDMYSGPFIFWCVD